MLAREGLPSFVYVCVCQRVCQRVCVCVCVCVCGKVMVTHREEPRLIFVSVVESCLFQCRSMQGSLWTWDDAVWR